MQGRLLWIGLLVALSPSLVELAGHWLAEPWSRYSALFVPLWVACALGDPGPPRPHRDGYALVALGVALCLVAVGGDMGRFGRPGIALAAIGMARVIGAPSLPRALLAAWVVPVPSFLLGAVPGVERVTAQGVAVGAHALGLEVAVRPVLDGVELVAPSGALLLDKEHGGLPIAALIAGLAWYAVVRRGGSLAEAAGSALCRAPWALVLQPLAIAAAGLLLAAGAPRAARAVLDPGLWLAVASFALLRIHAPRAAAPAGALPRAGR